MKEKVSINRVIPLQRTRDIMEAFESPSFEHYYEFDRHRIVVNDELGKELFNVRLPIHIPYEEIKSDYFEPITYTIVLIQSGSAAVGLFQGGENLDHKVFKSYMVRKKQGKSQIKYLNAKGKSRAGSRVRLANTIDFFENINERLQHYFDEQNIDRIALSCSKTLLPFIFRSKVDCPFDKKDERIFKIPRHVHTPGLEVLMNTDEYLKRSEIHYSLEQKEAIESVLEDID